MTTPPPTRKKVRLQHYYPQPHAASPPIPRWRHAKRPVFTIFLLPIQVPPLQSTNKITEKLGKDRLISDILTLHILSLRSLYVSYALRRLTLSDTYRIQRNVYGVLNYGFLFRFAGSKTVHLERQQERFSAIIKTCDVTTERLRAKTAH